MSQYKALFQTALDELEERFHVDEAIVAPEDVLIRYLGTEDSEVAIQAVGEVFTDYVDSGTFRREVKTIRMIKPNRDEWHVEDLCQTFRLIPRCGSSYPTFTPVYDFSFFKIQLLVLRSAPSLLRRGCEIPQKHLWPNPL